MIDKTRQQKAEKGLGCAWALMIAGVLIALPFVGIFLFSFVWGLTSGSPQSNRGSLVVGAFVYGMLPAILFMLPGLGMLIAGWLWRLSAKKVLEQYIAENSKASR